MTWKKTVLMFGLLLIVLSACSSESTEEKIHTHLEETVVLEQEFEAQQSEITELEKQEQEIYAQVIDLGMDDFEEITKLSQDAIALIEERKEKIDVESESIQAAKEEFQSIEALLDDLEEGDAKTKGEEMYQTMMDRYITYDDLYEAYKQSLDLETELYTLLQDEEVEQEVLNEQIEKINATYEQILTANDTFNELTVGYNELKQAFYEAANMEVTFEEE
ncbi:YkyA family protein [Oceanobacillus alkalisoli]|uniref:YkyA family protein n=1 Tax=Oceanobacillus alkalisoli TaxID=2925113 RepID=UPI001EEFB46E|nr:YkyA family protein [Oceanobacillus alkalisoli]MCF3944735.1 YkyA family protein [Oceanobacillus alkalisoli]MCG5104339.1 YkyA family protein [Oceanobacillus alkalisoli]